MPAELCDTCAYREGCETFFEPYNRLRSMICSFGGLPFYCHDNFDWRKTNAAELSASETMALRRQANICAGWRREVAARAKAGNFDRSTSRIRRRAAILALRTLEVAIKSEDPEKSEAYADLRLLIELLANPNAGAETEIANCAATIRSRRDSFRSAGPGEQSVPAVQPVGL